MSTMKVFKQKIETEVARAQTELETIRLRGLAFTAKAKEKHDAHVAELERRLDATKVSLRDLDGAEEHVWKSLKDGIEHTWGALQSALQDAIENIQTESPVADPHGSTKVIIPVSRT